MYATRIQQKKLLWGPTILVTPFSAHGTVSIVGSIVGGSRAAGNAELASVHATMLLEGTKRFNKKDIQLKLDTIGASLSFTATNDRLIFSGKVRSVHVDALLALVSEVLYEPMFQSKELNLLQKREEGTLDLQAQDTRAQASIVLSRLFYASTHPNYSDSTEEARLQLRKITRAQLLAYHTKVTDVGSLVLSVAGDTTLQNILRNVEKYFRRIPRSGVTLPLCDRATPHTARQSVHTIEHKASIDYMIGTASGITSEHTDYPALLLGVQILGNTSGFTGRLMSTVREKEGLTYGVYAYLQGFTVSTDGAVVTWGTFAPELFKKGRAAIRREIALLIQKGVTRTEVRKHRALYEARSRVQLSDTGSFAAAAHRVVVDGRRVSYLDTFPKRVLSLSVSDVNRAIKKYLTLENMSEVAAGPVEKNAFKA